MQIHGKSYEDFNSFDSITYDLSLFDFTQDTQQMKTIKCLPTSSACKFTVSRAFTPILFSINPPVVYPGSEIAFIVDPRAAQNKRSTTLPELPFIEARLDGYGVDFEDFIQEDDVLAPNIRN